LENQIIEVTKEDDSGWWQANTHLQHKTSNILVHLFTTQNLEHSRPSIYNAKPRTFSSIYLQHKTSNILVHPFTTQNLEHSRPSIYNTKPRTFSSIYLQHKTSNILVHLFTTQNLEHSQPSSAIILTCYRAGHCQRQGRLVRSQSSALCASVAVVVVEEVEEEVVVC
jgi:hypothetical protein